MSRLMIALAALTWAATAACSPPGGPEERNRIAFQAFVDAQNDRDFERLDTLLTAEMVRHSQATPGMETMKGVEPFKAYLEASTAEMPDWRIACPMTAAEGDLMGVWCTLHGTQEGPMGPYPASGKQMDLDFSGMLRFEGGKIAEWWVTWDNMAGLKQLGHMTPPSAPTAKDSAEAEG